MANIQDELWEDFEVAPEDDFNYDYVNLMPGNWFTLRKMNLQKSEPYDIDKLQAEILNHIANREEKMEDFGDAARQFMFDKRRIQAVEIKLDEVKFKRIAEIMETETNHPIFTFHGTVSNAIDSILENGYILQGDKNSKQMLKRVIDSGWYGRGIYSSPHIAAAAAYTAPDSKGLSYILINLLFLGVTKLISPNHDRSDGEIANEGFFKDGSNTRVIYGFSEMVTARPKCMIPIGYVVIK
jgi:hypothetical protein